MIRNWFRNFMVGRYGPDQLNNAVIITALIVWLLDLIFGTVVLGVVYVLLMALAIFRMFSRRLDKRRAENDRFLVYYWPLRRSFLLWLRRVKERKSYKFFKCPGCRNTLRVPKGKGTLNITCPKCGERFQKRT